MTNQSILKGGKRGKGCGRKGSRRRSRQNQNQNQNYNQNQNGGACGNSSSVAASYGGNVPHMMPPMQGGNLASSAYTAGNVSLVKGGASLLPNMGGNALMKGGESNPMLPPGTPVTGGSVLNELAVPAVLLYANNTFGKKRYTGKKYRGKKFRKSGKKFRR